MDTNLQDIALWGKDKLEETFSKLSKEGQELHMQIFRFPDAIVREWDAVKPSVSVPACRQVLDEAVTLSTQKLDSLTVHWEGTWSSIREQLHRQNAVFDAAVKRMKEIGQDSRYHTNYRVTEYLKETADPNMRVNSQKLFQTQLHNLIKGQHDETREWFHDTYQRQYREHLTLENVEKPIVVLDKCQRIHNLSLPTEIMLMVFSYADVESCVALREVSISWYLAFREADFETKLQSRDPLFTPTSVLQTWADCLLVFSHHLKWPTTDEVDTMELSRKKPDNKYMVGTELQVNQKLPTSCIPLMDDHNRNLMHYITGYREDYFQDPWTLETRRGWVDFKTVLSDATKTVIRYENIEITLPPGVQICSYDWADPEDWPVRIRGTTITVYLEDGSEYVLPRDKPHFENGRLFGPEEIANEMGALVVCQTGREVAEDEYYEFEDETEFHNELFDLATGKHVKYPGRTRARAVAHYNGLVWWNKSGGLVPAFYDLQTQKIYYSPHKYFAAAMEGDYGQCSAKKGLGHLVRSGNKMVDLQKGTVTTVEPHSGWNRSFHTLMGYDNGKFGAWCMEEDQGYEVRALVLKEYDMLSDEEGNIPAMKEQFIRF